MSLPQVVYHAVTHPAFAANLKHFPQQALTEAGFTLNPHEIAALQKVLQAISGWQDDIPLGPLPPWQPEQIEALSGQPL